MIGLGHTIRLLQVLRLELCWSEVRGAMFSHKWFSTGTLSTTRPCQDKVIIE